MFVPGYLPSPTDPRDYHLRPYGAAPQPLHYRCPQFDHVPVLDQGSVRGSCVGHAAASLKSWQELTERGQAELWSREYVYSRCKERDGIPSVQGTYPRVAMDVLRELGICPEVVCPYQAQDNGIALTSIMDKAASPQRIVAYARVTTLAALQSALQSHGPVLIGIPVFANWWTPAVQVTGDIPHPGGADQGGHALIVYGWETREDGLRLRLRNSWGTGWGRQGNGTLPADYPGLFDDAWLSIDLTSGGRIVRGD